MRPVQDVRLSCSQIHGWALQSLLDARLLRDHGPVCTAVAVWNVLLRAAAHLTSLL
jgi:hypothetical protein